MLWNFKSGDYNCDFYEFVNYSMFGSRENVQCLVKFNQIRRIEKNKTKIIIIIQMLCCFGL